jgi:hypothetical protein
MIRTISQYIGSNGEGKDQSVSGDAHLYFIEINKNQEMQPKHVTFMTALSKEMDLIGPSQHSISANVASSGVRAAHAAATRCTIHVIICFSPGTPADTDGRANSMPATTPHNALNTHCVPFFKNHGAALSPEYRTAKLRRWHRATARATAARLNGFDRNAKTRDGLMFRSTLLRGFCFANRVRHRVTWDASSSSIIATT